MTNCLPNLREEVFGFVRALAPPICAFTRFALLGWGIGTMGSKN